MRSMVLLLYPLISRVLAAMPEKPQMAKWAAARSGWRASGWAAAIFFVHLKRLGEQGRHQAQAEGEKQPRQRTAQCCQRWSGDRWSKALLSCCWGARWWQWIRDSAARPGPHYSPGNARGQSMQRMWETRISDCRGLGLPNARRDWKLGDTQSELEERHVLFMTNDRDRYIDKLFAFLQEEAQHA